MICVDGGSGLLAALPMVYDKIPVQRCWAHKIRNVLNKVKKVDEASVKTDLHAVMNADTATKARSAARRFASAQSHPAAVACLRDDLDELLTCFRYKTLAAREAVRTTNAIERLFLAHVRRRAAPMDVFQDRTSMDRILFAVFTHENKMQGFPTLGSYTKHLRYPPFRAFSRRVANRAVGREPRSGRLGAQFPRRGKTKSSRPSANEDEQRQDGGALRQPGMKMQR